MNPPSEFRFRGAGVKIDIARRVDEDRKLDEVKRRLVHTSLSIEKISRLSGYANVQRLKYVFKARTGLSMTDYRKSTLLSSKTDQSQSSVPASHTHPGGSPTRTTANKPRSS